MNIYFLALEGPIVIVINRWIGTEINLVKCERHHEMGERHHEMV